MNEQERRFEPVLDAQSILSSQSFSIGEEVEIKGRLMRIVRVTNHCIVFSPVGWDIDAGEDIMAAKERDRHKEEKRLRRESRGY